MYPKPDSESESESQSQSESDDAAISVQGSETDYEEQFAELKREVETYFYDTAACMKELAEHEKRTAELLKKKDALRDVGLRLHDKNIHLQNKRKDRPNDDTNGMGHKSLPANKKSRAEAATPSHSHTEEKRHSRQGEAGSPSSGHQSRNDDAIEEDEPPAESHRRKEKKLCELNIRDPLQEGLDMYFSDQQNNPPKRSRGHDGDRSSDNSPHERRNKKLAKDRSS